MVTLMDQQALQTLLFDLIAHWENEVVEFKNVGDSYSTSDIGKYFSALSNEANLRNVERAWIGDTQGDRHTATGKAQRRARQ